MEKAKLVAGVLALEGLIAGFHVVSQAALDMGVSKMAYLVYRNVAALVVVAPFAYFLEKKERPPLTLHLMAEFFILAVFGITFTQGFYIIGLYYLSPTYVSVIQNSIPAITFVMACGLRIEQVNVKTGYGLAKVVGTLLTVAGATVITLYKGTSLTAYLVGNHKLKATDLLSRSDPGFTWIAGCFLIFANCFGLSAWMVLQVRIVKKYPAKLSLFAIILAMGLIQLLAVAPFFDNDLDRWKVHSGGELLSILYVGIVATGLAWSLKIWCIDKGGPLFVAVFQPLQSVAIMAAVFLGDQLYTGGVIGAVIIVIGLYCVLRAKRVEKKGTCDLGTETRLERHLLDEDCINENP